MKSSKNEKALLEIAALGPTGVKRSCRDLFIRLGEEYAELREALEGDDFAAIMEEAADVAYYGALLKENGCVNARTDIPDWETMCVTLRTVLAKRYSDFDCTPWALHDLLVRAALAKYRTRFVKNKRVKNHKEEHAAIVCALDDALVKGGKND